MAGDCRAYAPSSHAYSGVVARLEESHFDGDDTPGNENYVWIEHQDGTVGRYAHLTNLGASVNVDQQVQQGDQIGISGNTGNSTGPHLHFDLVDSCDVRSAASYFELTQTCEKIPVNFPNAGPDGIDLSGGLRNERRYEALQYSGGRQLNTGCAGGLVHAPKAPPMPRV